MPDTLRPSASSTLSGIRVLAPTWALWDRTASGQPAVRGAEVIAADAAILQAADPRLVQSRRSGFGENDPWAHGSRQLRRGAA